MTFKILKIYSSREAEGVLCGHWCSRMEALQAGQGPGRAAAQQRMGMETCPASSH